MRTRWSDWVHATFAARGYWLPGDPRGFRDHDHRVHSSGDYHRPPPEGEHARLHAYAQAKVKRRVAFPQVLRPELAEGIAEFLTGRGCVVRIVCVDAVHAHVLVRTGEENAKPIIGRAKQSASRRVGDRLHGAIWGQGCHVVRVRDEQHYRTVVGYIEEHALHGAALWVHPRARAG